MFPSADKHTKVGSILHPVKNISPEKEKKDSAGQFYHDPFKPELYDSSAVESAFTSLEASEYNMVRLRIVFPDSREHQAASCAEDFDGWLFWTYNTAEQLNLWTLTDSAGALDKGLSPVPHPDPCSPQKNEMPINSSRKCVDGQ